jgi:hypothetical protein
MQYGTKLQITGGQLKPEAATMTRNQHAASSVATNGLEQLRERAAVRDRDTEFERQDET